jgi:hypothetical protein
MMTIFGPSEKYLGLELKKQNTEAMTENYIAE